MEKIEQEKLLDFLRQSLELPDKPMELIQYKGGYSNLTYLLKIGDKEMVLRRPPLGKKISKAHDMAREFRILEALQKAGYTKIPKPLLCCEDESIIGAPFFLMEKVDGLILRNKMPEGIDLTAGYFQQLSKNTIDVLLDLHHLDLNQSGLGQLGKPEGFVERQVSGWSQRYFHAKTDELKEMEQVSEWLLSHLPSKENSGFIHNDFKYDNPVLSGTGKPEIKAVLDWEMATVGDPLMDLGTTLAYWAEEGDPDIMKMFNLTHPAGNFSRQEVIDYYSSKSPLDLKDILFYYVFGVFKVGVIAQQIYKRYTEGFAADPRFASLIHVTRTCGIIALSSIKTNKI
jgi:aminoglycoside phosphotransferase (APT) family kinase protein